LGSRFRCQPWSACRRGGGFAPGANAGGAEQATPLRDWAGRNQHGSGGKVTLVDRDTLNPGAPRRIGAGEAPAGGVAARGGHARGSLRKFYAPVCHEFAAEGNSRCHDRIIGLPKLGYASGSIDGKDPASLPHRDDHLRVRRIEPRAAAGRLIDRM
jgi:hypothetical protein